MKTTMLQGETVKSLVNVHLISGSTFRDGQDKDAEALLSVLAIGVHHTLLPEIITHAVNCHDDLLSACKLALVQVRQDNDERKSEHRLTQYQLEAAIAKAEVHQKEGAK